MSTPLFHVWVEECIKATGGEFYPPNVLRHGDEEPEIQIGYRAPDEAPDIVMADGRQVRQITISLTLDMIYEEGDYDS